MQIPETFLSPEHTFLPAPPAWTYCNTKQWHRSNTSGINAWCTLKWCSKCTHSPTLFLYSFPGKGTYVPLSSTGRILLIVKMQLPVGRNTAAVCYYTALQFRAGNEKHPLRSTLKWFLRPTSGSLKWKFSVWRIWTCDEILGNISENAFDFRL